jgi:FKBP-type peptidyl-prolyl cis-trans isomerase
MKQLLSILSVALIVASCNSKYDKTPSGLAYKIIGNSKEKLKHGQVVKINGIVKLMPKDSTLFTTYGGIAEFFPYDSTTRKSHDFTEVLKLAGVGDSIVAIAQIDTLVKMGGLQYNEAFKKGGTITYNIKIVKAFTNDQDRLKDQQAELDKLRQREAGQIEAALKKKGVKAEKTPNGAYIQINNPGDVSLKAAPGKLVTAKYKGSLLESGKVFDSNTDPAFGHVQPFSFVVGSGQTIRAWDDAFPYLGKGGKATIYVPSLLGYGPPGNPPVIPPYASLVFEVEVTDVADAPKQPQGPPGMGQGNPAQQQQQQTPPPGQ